MGASYADLPSYLQHFYYGSLWDSHYIIMGASYAHLRSYLSHRYYGSLWVLMGATVQEFPADAHTCASTEKMHY